jgi:hypothetical protein
MFTIQSVFALNDLATRAWSTALHVSNSQRYTLGPLTFHVTHDSATGYLIERVDKNGSTASVRVAANLTELQRKSMGGKRLTGFAVIDMGRNVIVAEVDDNQIRDALGAGLVAAIVALP